jgi:hypothetical protein
MCNLAHSILAFFCDHEGCARVFRSLALFRQHKEVHTRMDARYSGDQPTMVNDCPSIAGYRQSSTPHSTLLSSEVTITDDITLQTGRQRSRYQTVQDVAIAEVGPLCAKLSMAAEEYRDARCISTTLPKKTLPKIENALEPKHATNLYSIEMQCTFCRRKLSPKAWKRH